MREGVNFDIKVYKLGNGQPYSIHKSKIFTKPIENQCQKIFLSFFLNYWVTFFCFEY